MNQNAPWGCAARGDEDYAEHTARAPKVCDERTLYFRKNARNYAFSLEIRRKECYSFF